MASTAPPSTNLLPSFAASFVFPQDLINNSSPSLRPKPHFVYCSKSLSLYPVLLHCRGRRKPTNWIDVYSPPKSWSNPIAVSAVVSGADVAVGVEQEVDREAEEEDDDDDYDEDGDVNPAFTPPTKPKKGKAALPLKRDRAVDKDYKKRSP